MIPNDLSQDLTLFIFFIALLGLVVGSFLNVVIWRLPIMMLENTEPTFNLAFPCSHCPQCQAPIAWYHNIPFLSYCWLKGKCHACKCKISARYPLVELLSMVLSIAVALKFEMSLNTAAALVLTWGLISLTFIDFDHFILPDEITISFTWLGLLFSLVGGFATPEDAIIGASAGYLSLWCIFYVFKLITGKEGMGYGDFKLLAMLGAWLGWQALPSIVLMSSLLGSIVGISLILFKNKNKDSQIPFGPYLAGSGFIYLLFGSSINQLYFSFVGL